MKKKEGTKRMLQIKNIKKEYKTGNLTQVALNGVSLNLRDSEFVAILGPSGSGKTTLLNIIGGLDRYDSGDLIINDVSTKKYKSRDWDSYRNHTVGFVFQSYNLIPHQTILSNVEIALTISGVGIKERKKRAKEALKKVGLEAHIHKKPNQLSGGQMQRVAIARALVNNPDILLADEPTGALDSETSVQVMELLKEVAKDRLVVMVTHNPELAEEYATRIVKVKDGKIIHDSKPFKYKAKKKAKHKRLGKSSMSLATSLSLSFNNLRSKLARTLLVSLAGSIGIIGIALVLALSNGVNAHIKSTEEETLKKYPLTITGTAIDMDDIMEFLEQVPQENSVSDDGIVVDNKLSTVAENENKNKNNTSPTTTKKATPKIKEIQLLQGMFGTFKTNDLSYLKEWLDNDEGNIKDQINTIEYAYNLKPNIYVKEDEDYRQVNPDPIMASFGYQSSYDNFTSMFTSSFGLSSDTFNSLPKTESLYKDDYKVVSGRWPKNYNECVVVLTANGQITDTTLYALNLKSTKGLNGIIQQFLAGDDVSIEGEDGRYEYSDIIGKKMKIVIAGKKYTYDEERKLWVSRASDTDFMNKLCEESEDLEVVGIVKPSEDADNAVLSVGINYTPELAYFLMDKSKDLEIVKQQIADPETDVLTGKPFGSESKTALDMQEILGINEEDLKKAFNFDTDSLDINLEDQISEEDFKDSADKIDLSNLNLSIPNMDLDSLLSDIKVNVSKESMEKLFNNLITSYTKYSSKDPSTDWESLPEAFSQFMSSDEAQKILSDNIRKIINNVGEESITDQDLTDFAQKILIGYEAYLKENGIPEDDRSAEVISEYLLTDEATETVRDAVNGLLAKLATAAISDEMIEDMATKLIANYDTYAQKNGLPVLSKLQDSFVSFLQTEEAQQMIAKEVGESIDSSAIETKIKSGMSELTSSISGDIENTIKQISALVLSEISNKIEEKLPTIMENVMAQVQDSFKFDEKAFAEALGVDFTPEELMELMKMLLSTDVSTYKGNLQTLGYADKSNPSTINIYAKDFDSKNRIKEAIDKRNEELKKAGEYDKVASYTDFVGLLMSSVTNIVNSISYVLIAFVAISLVVSSIMIGVITYISVLERKKEIGILRAIGASKRNISNVFNAETFIIGALSGILGILISLILLIPINIVFRNFTSPDAGAYITLLPALGLIALSTVLTMIGGFIPSIKASKQDPVIALRTE